LSILCYDWDDRKNAARAVAIGIFAPRCKNQFRSLI
jgi:hypothetical protein